MIPYPVFSVDLSAVRSNYRLLRDLCGAAVSVAAVVKADAYGLGAAAVVKALDSESCPLYFAATPDEALAVRAATDRTVAALNGVPPDAAGDFIRHDIIPVLNNGGDVSVWRAAAAKEGRRLPAILHFDTGMNRLGLASDADIQADTFDIRMIMSHFACADEDNHPLTARQYKTFMQIAARFPGVPRCLANSAGIFRDAAYRLDAVRPGMALYGLNPQPGHANPMRPVVSLTAPVLQVRRARTGETVGYGATRCLDRDTILATVGIGYADGLLRALGNNGAFYYKGRRCPLVGRVSMDLCVIAVEGAEPKPFDTVEILGPHQSADDLAAAAGTIGYEILTALGGDTRVRRVYAGG